ncbi:gluconate 2-dehydrogenase subunit 3 family protein [Sphingomonas phyllosphaerae]|uniref:gluconate 2-dehydrogenase subunit 3 family protein n=1 Tax=Sphingomonas phyllosphaerae TaxID=257003 RepID=UPI0004048231|nr:gluconate 2-dehydrogenase subunit 3 family protein [Sphingomonas phyllosphaerae]
MTFTRRTTLQWFATATALSLANRGVAAAAVSQAAGAAPPFKVVDWPASVAPMLAAKGYGRDPDLTAPKVPWPLTLTKPQRATIDMLGDMILPADGASPGAGTLGVGAFIDEWISAPYSQQQEDRVKILAGLAWLDAQSRVLHGGDFAAGTAAQRATLLDALTVETPSAAMAQPVAFMDRLRNLFVLGFYSLPEGKADMGYIGDQPTEGPYPGPTPEAQAHFAALLASLKLSMPSSSRA